MTVPVDTLIRTCFSLFLPSPPRHSIICETHSVMCQQIHPLTKTLYLFTVPRDTPICSPLHLFFPLIHLIIWYATYTALIVYTSTLTTFSSFTLSLHSYMYCMIFFCTHLIILYPLLHVSNRLYTFLRAQESSTLLLHPYAHMSLRALALFLYTYRTLLFKCSFFILFLYILFYLSSLHCFTYWESCTLPLHTCTCWSRYALALLFYTYSTLFYGELIFYIPFYTSPKPLALSFNESSKPVVPKTGGRERAFKGGVRISQESPGGIVL